MKTQSMLQRRSAEHAKQQMPKKGKIAVPMKPQSTTTSQASPGQSEKRDLLVRIYDELSDAGKQELLRSVLELSARLSSAKLRV